MNISVSLSFNEFEIRKPYILTDELELRLLLSNEDFLSRSEIESLIISENNINEGNGDENEDNSDNDEKDIEKTDKIWNSALPHFQMRVNTALLSTYYPFDFKESRLILKENWKDKPEYKLYLNLLIASRLKHVNRSSRLTLAYNFEEICRIATAEWLPGFDFKLFSLQSDDRRDCFDTNLRGALVKLANFIGEEPHEKQINKLHAAGDKGLDLVGVRRLSDGQQGGIVIFGQCKAKSQDFEKEVLEAHPINFNRYMTFSNNPINMFFIPASYRNDNNDFIKEKPVENCLFVDRQRLLSMIKSECISKMPLSSFELVQSEY